MLGVARVKMRTFLLIFIFSLVCGFSLEVSAQDPVVSDQDRGARVMLHVLSATHWGLSVVPIVAEHEQPGFHVFGSFCNVTGMVFSYLAGTHENSTLGEKVNSWAMLGIHAFTGFVNILGIVQNTPMPESSWQLGIVGSTEGGMIQITGEL